MESRLRRRFERHLESSWSEPLAILRMLLTFAREAGDLLNRELREDPGDLTHSIEVITRLHARACQVCDEVITLMRAGFADGAMARWRTLHEISVVGLLIQQHGEDLAKRFVEHQKVEAYHAACEYQSRHERLGYAAIPDDEFQDIELEYGEVINRYGKAFGTPYGWAAQCLGVERPTIAQIEKAIGTAHLRPYYRLASHNVHSTPKGAFFRLGLLEGTDLLLAGPSNAGLEEPGQNAGLCLLKTTLALALLKPTLDGIVAVKMMNKLTEELGPAFVKAGESLGGHLGSQADA
jgi:hypothetical protein